MDRKKIFVLGMSPMPFENDRKVYGTGIRTWQFVRPLLEKGHRTCNSRIKNTELPAVPEYRFAADSASIAFCPVKLRYAS